MKYRRVKFNIEFNQPICKSPSKPFSNPGKWFGFVLRRNSETPILIYIYLALEKMKIWSLRYLCVFQSRIVIGSFSSDSFWNKDMLPSISWVWWSEKRLKSKEVFI